MDDFYDLLEVSEDATQSDIKRAWRGKAREYHPDVNDDAAAGEQFKRLTQAKKCSLMRPTTRYDDSVTTHTSTVSRQRRGSRARMMSVHRTQYVDHGSTQKRRTRQRRKRHSGPSGLGAGARAKDVTKTTLATVGLGLSSGVEKLLTATFGPWLFVHLALLVCTSLAVLLAVGGSRRSHGRRRCHGCLDGNDSLVVSATHVLHTVSG